jgi:hypothetical protein
MTNEEFIAAYGDRAPMRIEGGCVLVDGWLDLNGCTGLTTLPEGLKVGGWLDLNGCTGLTTLPEGLKVGWWLDLNGCTGLTTLPEGLKVGWSLFLTRCTGLKALPDGLHVRGWLDLNGCTGLTTLPEGLKVGWSLFLTRCTGLTHWGSRPFRWTMADGVAAQIHSTRRLPDGTAISRASWLRAIAPGKPLTRCYIAERDGEIAHGDTAEDALRDLAFKIAARDFDPTETIAAIRQRGTVTRQDFRLLTGACEAGLRIGMADAGLDPDAQELPLDVVLAKAHGHFGAKFRERMEA